MFRMRITSLMLPLAVLVSAACALSCNEKELEQTPAPVIALAETELTIDSEGETVRVAYQVENPVEGVSLEVNCTEAWVEDIEVKARLFEFSVGKNDTGAIRTASIIVSYEGAEEFEITVSQEPWKSPIVLTVHETDATSVLFSVETATEDFRWIGQIVGKEWYESYKDDQAIYDADMAFFASEASYYGVTLEEYIATIAITGSRQNLKYRGLDPLTEYVLYVYGITTEGERTTGLYTAPIVTSEPYDGPMTFEFDIKETDAVMDITVTPSHDGVDYFWDLTTPEALAEYGDDRQKAVEKWLTTKVAEYIQFGEYADKDEYFEYNTVKNRTNSMVEGIVNTDYIFYAFKWDRNCEVIGEVTFFDYTTGDVAPSSNVITVDVSEITQSSFYVETTTTNDDPYFMIAEPVSEMSRVDMENDEEVFHYFYDWLGSFMMWDYISKGSIGGTFYELKPDTDYYVITFGYRSGALTTGVQVQTVRTLPSGDPKDCVFEFEISNLKTTSAEVTVKPSDKGHYYYWDVFPASMSANMVKQEITKKFKEEYYSDMWEFSYELALADDQGYLNYLLPATDYKIAAVIIDRNADNLKFLGNVNFSDIFTTPEAKVSATSVTCGFKEYYDGDAIAAIEPDKFGGMAGYPWIPLAIDIDGDYAEYYYTLYDYQDGLEDAGKYPDEMFYDQLFSTGWSTSLSMLFRGKWDTPLMVAAIAIDLDGNYTKVYRKKFTLTKEGAAPAINFINSYGKDTSSSAPAKFNKPANKVGLKKNSAGMFMKKRDIKSFTPASHNVK